MFVIFKGYVTSYFGQELQKYSSFKVHHEEIRHMTANESGILSLSSNELCFSARTGLHIFSLRFMYLSIDESDGMLIILLNCHFTQYIPINRGKVT